jgi:hypothetical protein
MLTNAVNIKYKLGARLLPEIWISQVDISEANPPKIGAEML